MMIRFFVPGIPRPAGSKRAIPLYVRGRLYVKNGRPIINMVDDSGEKGKEWREIVGATAKANFIGEKILECPVRLCVAFIMPRPLDHYMGKNKENALTTWAPALHTSKPDATKLLRAIEDALTGVIWKDDAQVCWQVASKKYGSKPGAEVSIEPVGSGFFMENHETSSV